MIKANIKESALYANCNPAFAAAFDFLKNANAPLPDGEVFIGDIKAIICTAPTKPAAEKKMETHRKNIDMHYVASGSERHFFGNAENFEIKIPYSAEKDAQFYFSDESDFGKTQSFVLSEGEFAVYFPEDAHKAMCNVRGKPETVKKIVLKIPVG